MTTSAMFVMQYEAMHEKNETTYFFPEWGFSTSFVLITDNRVRFSYDAKPEAFLRELKLGRDLAILTWNENNAREWAASLESLISKPKVDIISYYTRQRSVAFYKVVATPS